VFDRGSYLYKKIVLLIIVILVGREVQERRPPTAGSQLFFSLFLSIVPKYLLYGDQLIDTAENEANRDLLGKLKV
jgi:hypothetical protein